LILSQKSVGLKRYFVIISKNFKEMNTVLKVSTFHCPPCKLLKPVFNELKDEFKGKINFLEVSDDGDYQLFEKYALKFSIRSVPVVLILDSEENELERITGLAREDVYREAIKKHS